MSDITLPYKYEPRDYQLPLLEALDSGKRYACIVWHRRGGKDITCWNYAIRDTAEHPQSAKYAFPTSDMARDNLWDAYTNDGLNFTDFAPQEIRAKTNTTDSGLNETFKEMEFITGGKLRVISAHKPQRLRGGNDKLYVLSEFQLMDPVVIDIIEPVLEANNGKLLVNMTPAGDNHAKGTFEAWQSDPDWFTQVLTAEETTVFSKEQLQKIKDRTISRFIARGLSEDEGLAFFEQEYYCSFDSPVVGSYFGAAMRRAQQSGRITKVPHEANLDVHTAWDLGVDDSTSIWFFQMQGREIRLIDYFESSGEGLPFYARVLRGQIEGFERMRDYTYGNHYAPHDIMNRELTTGVSRKDTASQLGIQFIETKRVQKKEDGIDASRGILSRCWFDEANCKRGINGLKGYHKEWDEKLLVYKPKPVHDWTSHPADAFQTLALNNPQPVETSRQINQDQMRGGFAL